MKNVKFVLFCAILVCGFNIDANAQTYTVGREVSEMGRKLESGKTLYPGEEMRDDNAANFRLRLTTEGELKIVYHPWNQDEKLEWSAGTGGQSGNRLVMQKDGNLVLYKGTGTDASDIVWSSGSPQVIERNDNFMLFSSKKIRINFGETVIKIIPQ